VVIQNDLSVANLTMDMYKIYQEDFSALDVDGSGALDEAELKVLLARQADSEPSPTALKTFFEAIDKNSDGKIEFGEYMNNVLGRNWTLEGLPVSHAALSPSITEILDQIRSGKKTCVEIVQEMLDRIAAVNGDINACIEVMTESSLQAAADVDAKVASGTPLRVLEGCPLLVKTNIDVAGSLTTAATPAMANWRPQSTAPCAAKLIDAGAIIIAKSNMPELATRVDPWNPIHALCRNPHALHHNPGGSSSGTAAGIAAGMAPAGLGSDTYGSMRLPAACCGVVGFRPSMGRWSGDGIVCLDSGRDTAGPMAQTVKDVATLDAVVNGEEPVEPATLSTVKVLIPTDWMEAAVAADLLCESSRAAVEQVATVLQSAGATVLRETDFKERVLDKMFFGTPVSESVKDLQGYLDTHPERPESMKTTADVVANAGAEHISMFYKDRDSDKIAEAKVEAKALETAYREYFGEKGVTAVLVPSMAGEPTSLMGWTKEKEESAAPHFMSTAFYTIPFNHIPVPCITMPTRVKARTVGAASGLRMSVMLYGTDDRELLSLAVALEAAL